MCVFVQGFSEDVFSQFDPVLGNKVRKNFSLPSNQVFLLKKREIMKSYSGLVRQRVRLGDVQDPDQLELLAGEPSRPLHHQDHLPPSTQDGVAGVRLVQPYPQGGRQTLLLRILNHSK